MKFQSTVLLLMPLALVHSSSVHVTLVPAAANTTIIGETNDGVDRFLGIQYAKVGERFARSSLVDAAHADNITHATSFGPNCFQAYRGVHPLLHTVRDESEECLYLNIWRPASSDGGDKKGLSTMVWFHGGGFAIGSGADPFHNGAQMARDQDVIVVTFNYRLGALASMPNGPNGGMNMLYDQLMALEWIHRYIASFRGSPDDVTVFGESAGAESICMLAVSPLAAGLFQRAILQSGECINNNWSHGIPVVDQNYASNLVDALLNQTGASSIAELSNVTKYPAAELNAQSIAAGWPLVVLDEDILPDHPRVLYQDPSNVVPNDFIVGANSYEDSTFLGVDFATYSFLASDPSGWVEDLVGPGSSSAAIVQAYLPDDGYGGDPLAAFAQLNGDYYIRCPVREFAAIVSATSNVYLYNFAHFARSDPAVWLGIEEVVGENRDWASHLAEIPFVFGTLSVWTNVTTEDDIFVSRDMQSRWASFARNGVPGDGWVPLLSEPNLLGGATEDRSSFVFQRTQSQMKDMTTKAEQCSAFPMLTRDSLTEDSPDSGSYERNAGQWLRVLLAYLLGFFIFGLLEP